MCDAGQQEAGSHWRVIKASVGAWLAIYTKTILSVEGYQWMNHQWDYKDELQTLPSFVGCEKLPPVRGGLMEREFIARKTETVGRITQDDRIRTIGSDRSSRETMANASSPEYAITAIS